VKRGAILAGFFACTLVGRIWADSYGPFTYSDVVGYQNNLFLFRGPLVENNPVNDISTGSLLARYGFWKPSDQSFDISLIDRQQYSLELALTSGNASILSGTVHPFYFSNPSTSDYQFGIQILFTPDLSAPSFFYEAIFVAPNVATAFIEDGSQSVVGEKTTAGSTINIGLVPEPSALSLLAVGLGGLAMIRRRRS
jgi:hypothetical protein